MHTFSVDGPYTPILFPGDEVAVDFVDLDGDLPEAVFEENVECEMIFASKSKSRGVGFVVSSVGAGVTLPSIRNLVEPFEDHLRALASIANEFIMRSKSGCRV